MNLQVINSVDGSAEYVLLPISTYEAIKPMLKEVNIDLESKYVPFELTDYVSNPVALARIKANLTQKELANLLEVSQAYISKLESKDSVSAKTLDRVRKAIIIKDKK